MSPARRDTLISDFGGVLTSPLLDAFMAVQAEDGVPLDALGRAMAAVAEDLGVHPLAELETGRMRERDFLGALERAMAADLGRHVSLERFPETWWRNLHVNEELLACYRALRSRGVTLAICTNNVREWEERWRSMLPVDELFAVVVDSAFVGVRKPDRRIYEIVLERLDRRAERAVFVDDVEENVTAAVELGMAGVVFRDTASAMAEIKAALAGDA